MSGGTLYDRKGKETGVEENPLHVTGELELDQEQVIEQLETLNESNDSIYSGIQESNGRMQGFQQQMGNLLSQLLTEQGKLLPPLVDGDGKSRLGEIQSILSLVDNNGKSILEQLTNTSGGNRLGNIEANIRTTATNTGNADATTKSVLAQLVDGNNKSIVLTLSQQLRVVQENQTTLSLRSQQTNELLGTLVALTMQNNPNLAVPLPSGMTTFLDVKVPGYYYLDTAKSNAMTDHPKPNSGGWFLEVKPPQQTNGDQVKTLYQNSRNTPEVWVRNDTATTAGTWNKLNN